MSEMPKLPPKWDYKRMFAEYGQPHGNGIPRKWKAAILEVEWRKRAERWEILISRQWVRWVERGRREPRVRILMRLAANQCYDIARQWREWGSK